MFNCCEPEIITKALQQIQINPQIHHYFHHPPRPTSTPSAPNAKAAATKLSVESRTPPKILLGAYANRLTHVDPEWTLEASSEAQGMREDLSPEQYWEEFVRRWQVQLIGGCCGIGPEYIACLRKHLSEKDG